MNTACDLEERLLEYSARVIRLVERLPSTRAGNHIADVSTTMIYTHVLRQGGSGMKSPLDCL